MASLGFRRPQFSEEAAWLPDWLQNSQATAFDKLTKESEEAQIKLSEGNVNEKSREDGQYNNCCLFLSGAENSGSSLTSPSASVLHLSLHLSSDGNFTQGLPIDDNRAETAKASACQSDLVRMPSEVRQKSNPCNSCEIVGTVSLLTKPTTTTIPEVFLKPTCSKGKTHVKSSKDGPHKYGYFDHAVEISIAASEALLIHELLEGKENSAVVPASALLDVSLKVKQARLQWVEEDSLINDLLNESSDYLSDLDDSAMVDAFVDVGLCATSSGDSFVSDSIMSHVNESPQTDLEADYKFGQSDVPTPEVAVGWAIEKYSEENRDMDTWSVKALEHDARYREATYIGGEYPVLMCDIGGLELCTSGQENAKLETKKLQDGFNMPKPDSRPPQPQFIANTSQSQDHRAPEDCPLKNFPLGKFNSRWLGGWTRKDDFPNLILDNKKYTVKSLSVERSSLSESVDVPDKSSYVDGKESKHLTSVQGGTAFNVFALTNMVEDEMLISPEIAKHSSSLSIDPLCSVVPCSLLSETPQSVQNFLKGGELLVKNDPCSASRYIPGILNLTSDLMVKVQGMRTVKDRDSDLKVQKRSTSLNNYSLMFPSQNEIGTVPISHDQFLCHCNSGKKSCHRTTNNDTYIACGSAISTTPYVKSTNFVDPSSKGLPSIGNATDDVIDIRPICKNSSPEQELPVYQIKGIDCLRTLEGLCRDKKLDCPASQRMLDDFSHQIKSYVPSTEVTCAQDIQVLLRKRVHFKEDEADLEQSKWFPFQKRKTGSEFVSTPKFKKLRTLNLQPEKETYSQEVKRQLTNYRPGYGDKLIFHGLEFLLTGFPKKKVKEVEQLIIRYGGIVLFDILSPNSKGSISFQSNCQKLPVVLCLKKVETTKFLYGCAVNACILKVNWLLDSVSAGSVLQPEKYMIFSNQAGEKHTILRLPRVCKLVFEGVGIMFHGKHSFCTKLSRIVTYGGGLVFKTLQWLVQSSERRKLTIQAVVVEDRCMVSRHLKQCAMERNLPIVSGSWIISSLHSGKLLPYTESDLNFHKPVRKTSPDMPLSLCLSQEI